MRELNLSEMTLEQKIGQLICIRGFHGEEDTKDIFESLARGEVGAVQVRWKDESSRKLIRDIREAADYNILICADMETGFQGSKMRIPYQMSISYADEEALAYEIANASSSA